MNMIRVLSLTLALVCSPLLNSCSDGGDSRPRQAQQLEELDGVVELLQKAEKDISQGFLLRNATPRSKQEVTDSLYEMKIASYRLQNDLQDVGGLDQLFLAFQTYNKITLLKDDETFLGSLKQSVLIALDAVSTVQGRSLDGIERPLFEKAFQENLEPFTVATIKGSTERDWGLSSNRDVQYLKIGDIGKGTEGAMESWLLSPRLDLSVANNLGLVIEQTINVSRDSKEKFADVVSVLVTTDPITDDLNAVNWKPIKIKTLPKGTDYIFVKSEMVDLKEYQGKSIVIAFKFASKGNSFVVWELTQFAVWGTGKVNSEALKLSLVQTDQPKPEQPKPKPEQPKPVPEGTQASLASLSDFAFGEVLTGIPFKKAGSEAALNSLKENYKNKDADLSGARFSSYYQGKYIQGGGPAWMESVDIEVTALSNLTISLTEGIWIKTDTENEAIADLTTLYDRVRVEWAPVLTDPGASLEWNVLNSASRPLKRITSSKDFGSATSDTKFNPFQVPEGVKRIRIRLVYDFKGNSADPFWVIRKVTAETN